MASRIITRALNLAHVRSSSALGGTGLPRLVDCQQGDKVKSTFSEGEMQRRMVDLRRHMASSQIDACLLTSYHNINYFADFLYCAFGRPYGLVVTHDDATLLVANIDYGQPSRRFHGGKTVTYTDWHRDNYFYGVKQATGDAKRIGFEGDHLPMDNLTKVKQMFSPATNYVDVGKPTMLMRTVKSAEEIALIKEGARVADIGGEAAKKAIQVGIPEYKVAMQSTAAMVQEIAKAFPHAELMDTWTWFQSGINTDGAHNPSTSRVLQSGDVLSLNCFPMIAGYYTALERTLYLGEPSPRALEIWEVNCKVHRRGLELLRPGVKCKDVALELNDIYASHDLLRYRTFGYGHSFGVLSHYYGREAVVELREDIDTVLEPNMVVSMEPMLTIPHGTDGAGGYREHDIVVITKDGGEDITKFPFGPEHNIIEV